MKFASYEWRDDVASKILGTILCLSLGGLLQAKPAATPPKTWTFVGEGVLDLEKEDLKKPITVDLKQQLGHFVRVILPAGFDNSGCQVFTSAGVEAIPRQSGNRTALDLVGSCIAKGTRELVAVQAGNGHSIILTIRMHGVVASGTELVSFLRFWTDYQRLHNFAFPEEAGDPIGAALPEIRLPISMILSKNIHIDALDNHKGGKVAATISSDLTCEDDDGPVLLPAGSKILGLATLDPVTNGGKNTLDLCTVVFPDGRTRDTSGTLSVHGRALL
jgi:hypothetical protein